MRQYKYIFTLLFISPFIGLGANTSDSGIPNLYQYLRIGILTIIFIYAIFLLHLKSKFNFPQIYGIYFVGLVYSLITLIWAPLPFFAGYKIYELLVCLIIFVIFCNIISDTFQKYLLFDFFIRLLLFMLFITLLSALINPLDGFRPNNPVLKYQLRGSLFIFNANDVGFASAIVFIYYLINPLNVKLKYINSSLLLSLTTLLLSQSRIFTILTFILILIYYFNKKKLIQWTILLVILTFIASTGVLKEYLIRDNIETFIQIGGRISAWEKGIEIFKNSPIWGHGFYTGHRFYFLINETQGFSSNTFDNSWLDILVDLGIVGFVIFAFFHIKVIINVLGNYKSLLPLIIIVYIRSFLGPGLEVLSIQIILIFLISLLSIQQKYLNNNDF